MPTPVGPAPRDPNDPDLWEDWYEGDVDSVPSRRFGWPVRILAIIVIVTLAVLIILGG